MWMTIATALTALIAVLHGYFMWLEMCGWTRPAGRRAFGLTIEFAEQTRRLAANQGLYNGFLAAGLAWSLWPGSPAGLQRQPQEFLDSGRASRIGAGCAGPGASLRTSSKIHCTATSGHWQA